MCVSLRPTPLFVVVATPNVCAPCICQYPQVPTCLPFTPKFGTDEHDACVTHQFSDHTGTSLAPMSLPSHHVTLPYLFPLDLSTFLQPNHHVLIQTQYHFLSSTVDALLFSALAPSPSPLLVKPCAAHLTSPWPSFPASLGRDLLRLVYPAPHYMPPMPGWLGMDAQAQPGAEPGLIKRALAGPAAHHAPLSCHPAEEHRQMRRTRLATCTSMYFPSVVACVAHPSRRLCIYSVPAASSRTCVTLP